MEHNGKFKVTLGSEIEVIERPRGKDVDTQMIVDLRRMLTGPGFRRRAHSPQGFLSAAGGANSLVRMDLGLQLFDLGVNLLLVLGVLLLA